MVVDVLEVDVDRRAGDADLLRAWQQARAVDSLAHGIAEAQRMDQRAAVLQLAIKPDEGGLPEGLDLSITEQRRG